MKLNAPKQLSWIIALILLVAALAVNFTGLAPLTVGFWLAVASACLLILATFFSGL
ncbi:MAG: hypothetical protein IKD87_05430 [Oscillospiraceae bacterium]|nr:hypothetical protein [Oscillospiraceae bacterium]MBR2740089.1 hypothetical protein [Oscillospiraceae bacterium]